LRTKAEGHSLERIPTTTAEQPSTR